MSEKGFEADEIAMRMTILGVEAIVFQELRNSCRLDLCVDNGFREVRERQWRYFDWLVQWLA
jgi:hypothetical protein